MKLALLLGTLAVGALYVGRGLYASGSLLRADCLELSDSIQAWIENGKPAGKELILFMQGRRPDLVATNATLLVQGIPHYSHFAVTNLRSRPGAILFATTNGDLILETTKGRLRLLDHP